MELTMMLSKVEVNINCEHSVRFSRGEINNDILQSTIGKTLDLCDINSHSRRLLRHITVTGDIIHEYEYQEDGHSRLFTLPGTVTQNSNRDICVVNRTSFTTGQIVILSLSEISLSWTKSDRGLYKATDVVCDSLCNILVTDKNNKQIHLLSSDREFLKLLLTDNEVNRPVRFVLF
ncbi:uncharacterized protein LOC134238110 [Saccostrea cucullata]|uniref:uncharacterized protein LOC134238110 n=1 Tax=Saccostrea cuccullata TaxID=36930 RepID=UPI002ED52A3A